MTLKVRGTKFARECLPASEEADSSTDGLMNWCYMVKLAAPAGEVKEISPATCSAPLTAAPEMFVSSQPRDANKAVVLIKSP